VCTVYELLCKTTVLIYCPAVLEQYIVVFVEDCAGGKHVFVVCCVCVCVGTLFVIVDGLCLYIVVFVDGLSLHIVCFCALFVCLIENLCCVVIVIVIVIVF
jgi:hypothetical protein